MASNCIRLVLIFEVVLSKSFGSGSSFSTKDKSTMDFKVGRESSDHCIPCSPFSMKITILKLCKRSMESRHPRTAILLNKVELLSNYLYSYLLLINKIEFFMMIILK